MYVKMKYLVCLILQLMCITKHYAQIITQPIYHNYTVDEGLPSMEVYGVEQDSDGYLWFATDHGLSRYDGYHFLTYGKEQGLDEIVILKIRKDRKGVIWIKTLSGNLYTIKNGTIKAYPYNHIFKNYKLPNGGDNFYIDEVAGSLILPIYEQGILEIDKNGKSRMIRSSLSPAYLFKNFNGIWVSTLSNLDRFKGEKIPSIIPVEYALNDGSTIEAPFKFTGRISSYLFHQLDRDTLLVNIGHDAYVLNNQTLIGHYNTDEPIIFAKKETDGKIWTCHNIGGGLHRFSNILDLNKRHYQTYLDKLSVSSIFKDKENKYWVTTTNNGVYYCQNWEQMVYGLSGSQNSNNIVSTSAKNENLYIGFENGQVYSLNVNKLTKEAVFLADYGKGFSDLKAFPCLPSILAVADGKLMQGKSEITLNRPIGKLTGGNNCSFIWLKSGAAFFRYNFIDKKITLATPDIAPYKRCISLYETNPNYVLLGFTDGLYFFDGKKLQALAKEYPAFSARIEDIGQLTDSTYVIATKGAGIVFWKGNKKSQITHSEGLLSDLIEKIHITEDGTIWAVTFLGINKIKQTENNSWQIESYTMEQGLPSNYITSITSIGSQIWVATNKGLTKLQPREKSNCSASPKLINMRVNGANISNLANFTLSHNQNNIHFLFLTIRPHLMGKIIYRYRLYKEAPWQETQNTDIEFPSLSSGNYSFEVQSQNEDGVWSKTLAVPFQILKPWWYTTWFILLVILMIVLLFYRIFKYRISIAQKENQVLLELYDLERQSLQGQMNPHFIFNCLNAIQRFISSADKHNAMRYLSKFANLIRMNLQHISKKKILLSEELYLLESYIELELMRHKNLFDYKIEISPKIEPSEIELAPMLIQPLVENAIIHGISPKGEKGMLSLKFDSQNGYLLVEIKDDGVGFSTKENSSHNSMGIELVRKRLALLNGEAPEKCFGITRIHLENSNLAETVLSLKILLQQ